MSLWHGVLDLLYPPRCILCGRILDRRELDLCADCRTEGPVWTGPKRRIQFLDSFTAVWYYEYNARTSLLRYKFHNARSHAQGYGRLLAMKLVQEYPESFDLVTWVPISPLRRLQRGYDQDALLAQAVGRELDLVSRQTIRKIRHNRRQSRIRDDAMRRANVLGAYRVIDPAQVRGKRILLLDDILTTGATLGECARILKTAGAKEVHCAAVAAVRTR